MWEVSLAVDTGAPAVMRNIGNGNQRVLVKTCASVEEAEALIETLNAHVLEEAKGKTVVKTTTEIPPGSKESKKKKHLPPWLEKDETDNETPKKSTKADDDMEY